MLRFSLPILLALFLQALYGAVDMMVVGKYAAAADVSGVAVGSQIMMTITNLISSFAMGTTILLGQKLGEGDRDSGGKIIGASIAAAFLIRIPVAYIMSRTTGRLFFIGLGIPCATVLQITACFVFYGILRRKQSVSAGLS